MRTPIVVILVYVSFIVGFIAVMAVLSQRRKSARRAYWRSLPHPSTPLPDGPTCPRCQARMAIGYLLDRIHGGYAIGAWVEGPPEPGVWTDTVRPKLDRSIPITVYRCNGCGRLELFARPELLEKPDEAKPKHIPEL